MSEDERLAWARLVSGRAVESHRLWRRYYDDPSSLTDEERSDGVLQCELVRVLWRGTAHVALAAIGYLGDTFSSASPVDAVDTLGMVMCHVGALAELSELTMSAVIGLALQRLIDGEVPLLPSSDLARSLSFRGDHEMSARLDALAGVVARAMDDVHINHGVEVKPMELYRRIAYEVIAGRMPVLPERDPLELRYSLERQLVPAPRLEFDRRTRALGQLADAVRSIHGPPGIAQALGGPILPAGLTGEALRAQAAEVDGALGRLMESEFAAAHAHIDANERELQEHGYGGKAAVDPEQIVGLTIDPMTDRESAEAVGLKVGDADEHLPPLNRSSPLFDVIPRLAEVERSSITSSLFGRGAVPGLAEQRICPQCAGLLSERGDGMLACPSQHEFTAQQLQAIAAASTATEPTG